MLRHFCSITTGEMIISLEKKVFFMEMISGEDNQFSKTHKSLRLDKLNRYQLESQLLQKVLVTYQLNYICLFSIYDINHHQIMRNMRLYLSLTITNQNPSLSISAQSLFQIILKIHVPRLISCPIRLCLMPTYHERQSTHNGQLGVAVPSQLIVKSGLDSV